MSWRSLVSANNPSFLVKGTELSVRFTKDYRYGLYEVRCLDADGNHDRRYHIRDATTVTLEQVSEGVRPFIVWRGETEEEAEAFMREHRA